VYNLHTHNSLREYVISRRYTGAVI